MATSPRWVVNFVISDTFYAHLPKRKADNVKLGTQLQYVCPSLTQAVKLANKLIHLTTGDRENTKFHADRIRQQRLKRVSWSNDMRTHHCELLQLGENTQYTSRTHRGEPEDDEERGRQAMARILGK